MRQPDSPERHLLLISSSRVHGSGYLDHCAAAIQSRLEGVHRILFIPYALHDLDAYAALAADRFARLGFELTSIHSTVDPVDAVSAAESVFIGGGNTFRLLSALWRHGLIPALRRRVAGGMPYLGSSAGTNVACPTICTTNDMPIVQPPTLEALALIPFQINPHYVEADPSSKHQGETRDMRIQQFHEESDVPVLGLREGAMLRVNGRRALLEGVAGARLFKRHLPPEEVAPGSRLDGLLRPATISPA